MVVEEPRSARREATRQRILDAARVVFAEKGVFGASIEDICEQAGFTRGAVYSNFADKDDILREVIEREHQALLDHIAGSIDIVDEELAAAPSLEAAVASLVNRIVRTIPSDREVTLISTELEIVAVRRPELAASFLAVNNAFRAGACRVPRRGARARRPRADHRPAGRDRRGQGDRGAERPPGADRGPRGGSRCPLGERPAGAPAVAVAADRRGLTVRPGPTLVRCARRSGGGCPAGSASRSSGGSSSSGTFWNATGRRKRRIDVAPTECGPRSSRPATGRHAPSTS